MKAFAAVVLICISFAWNCIGQKVEVKQDSIYYTNTEYENNVLVHRYKILKDSQPIAIAEKLYTKFHLDYNKKYKTDFSGLEFKMLNFKKLAYINLYAKIDEETKEEIMLNRFSLSFNTEKN